MTVSVVLSVYNGREYILEQLGSLVKQTRLIDEVYIIDDCSKDETPFIIQKYIEENGLNNWKLKRNIVNRGWKVNFVEGMQAASGDIIFPCDQDDIWREDKIELMASIIESDSAIEILEGKPHKFYQEDGKIGTFSARNAIGIILDKIHARATICTNTGKVVKKDFDKSFMNRAPGCCLAVRKETVKKYIEYWFDDMPHDALITYFPNLSDGYYIIDREVIDWRQHVGSASRPTERNKSQRIKELELDKKMIDEMIRFSNNKSINVKYIRLLQQAKEWNKIRFEVVRDGKIYKVIHLLRYSSFYLQKRRIITDIKYGLR